MGLLRIPDDKLVDIADVERPRPGQVCVISTGSQGEPLSALALMAAGENRWLKLGPDDTVILSSHPIPGNESNVSQGDRRPHPPRRRGGPLGHRPRCTPAATPSRRRSRPSCHVAEPEWFTRCTASTATCASTAGWPRPMGIDPDKVLICEDGDQLVLSDDGHPRVERAVPAGYLYVDGIVGDVGHGVLRDRRVLAEEGVVVVVVTIDVTARRVLAGPEIITRGWVHAPEAEDLLDECARRCGPRSRTLRNSRASSSRCSSARAPGAGRFVNERTKRRPMIVPVVLEA